MDCGNPFNDLGIILIFYHQKGPKKIFIVVLFIIIIYGNQVSLCGNNEKRKRFDTSLVLDDEVLPMTKASS